MRIGKKSNWAGEIKRRLANAISTREGGWGVEEDGGGGPPEGPQDKSNIHSGANRSERSIRQTAQ